MPPWALFYAYRILVFQLHFREEDSALSDVIAVLKLALERLDVRWNIATPPCSGVEPVQLRRG